MKQMDNSAALISKVLCTTAVLLVLAADSVWVALYPTRHRIKQTRKTAPGTIPRASGLRKRRRRRRRRRRSESSHKLIYGCERMRVHLHTQMRHPNDTRRRRIPLKTSAPHSTTLLNQTISMKCRCFYGTAKLQNTYTGRSARAVPRLPKSLPQIPLRNVYC
jgi:hypothetical protein